MCLASTIGFALSFYNATYEKQKYFLSRERYNVFDIEEVARVVSASGFMVLLLVVVIYIKTFQKFLRETKMH